MAQDGSEVSCIACRYLSTWVTECFVKTTLASQCTIPIQEAVGNGFPKEAPRVGLRRYSTCSHENLFLGKKFQKKLTAAKTLKGTRPQPLLGAYGAR